MGHKKGFYEKYIKRPQDFLCAGAAAVVLSPVMAVTAVLVRVKLGSPVIFKQKRPGLNGKIFELYKFRTMTDEKDEKGNLLPDELRLTGFGKALRATSLDELPELINILKGDMAVVGPRPASVDQVPITRGGDNAIVSSVKPGLTSPAALYDYLYGDSILDEAEYMDKVAPTRLALDRYYVGKQTLGYDAKMIWYTVRCIIGTIMKKPQIGILEEMIMAVDGDKRALQEVTA